MHENRGDRVRMIIALGKCFASGSMDKPERKGRHGRQSRRGRQRSARRTGRCETKTARRIQSARPPSKCRAIVPASQCEPRSSRETHERTSQGEMPLDVGCKNEENRRKMSSTSAPAVAEVATPRVANGRRCGMSGRIETLTPGRSSIRPPSVPSVVYVTPQRPPKPSVTSTKIRVDLKNANPRLELEDKFFGVDIDASTISASPSTHSLSNDVDLESIDQRKKKESARFGESESNEAAAPRPPQRQPSRKLNPNAPIYVPDQVPVRKLARPWSRRALARAFGRPSPTPDDALEVSGRDDVQRRLTTRPQKNPLSIPLSPSPPRLTFPVAHPLARVSRLARPAPKVTVVSEEFKVFVVDLLSEEDCDWVLQCAEQHVADAAIMGQKTWRKIYTHTRLDLPCSEVPTLRNVTNYLLMQVRQIVGKTCKARRAASSLVPRSWKEPHLLRYQKMIPHLQEHDHTGMIMHHDGGDLSWHLMLSTQGVDYNGGGTYFRCLRKTIILRKGQVLIHPGNLYHRGVDITAGSRTLIVCFMDGYDLKVEDPSDPEEDSEEFQRNVVIV